MPISLVWADEAQTLIFAKFEGKLESEEFLAAEPVFRAMLESVSNPVDMIVQPIKQLYFSPSYVQTTRKLHLAKYPNLRLVIFVGRTLTWELFVMFAHRFKRIPYQFDLADTLEEAHQMIKSFRVAQAVAPPTSSANWN